MSNSTNPRLGARKRGRALLALVLLAGMLAALGAAPALGSVREEQQGARILRSIHAGKLLPSGLSSSQYEHVGEYLMGRALGSSKLHERMSSLMDEMMGPAASDRMHVYLAERYLGESVRPSSRYGALYGLMGVMMSGYHGSPLAGMMSRYLSGRGQENGAYPMGPGMMGHGYGGMMGYAYGLSGSGGGGLSTGAIIAIVLGSLALLGVVTALALRMRVP